MTYKPLKNQSIKDLKTKEGTEEIFECKNCSNHVKVDYYLEKVRIKIWKKSIFSDWFNH